MPDQATDILLLALGQAQQRYEEFLKKQEKIMGVVADTLNQVVTQVGKVHQEIVDELNKLASRPSLDEADIAAIQDVKTVVQKLDDIVPDVVEAAPPLPDPAPAEAPAESDPATVTSSDQLQPAPEVQDSNPPADTTQAEGGTSTPA